MIRSMTRSTIENKVNYRSLLAGNTAFDPFTSDYELLETIILDSSASTVSFTGLNSYTDYKHLQLRLSTFAVGTTDSVVRFNSDAGNNYAWHLLVGNGSSVLAFNATSVNFARIAYTTNFTPGAGVVDILDFSSTSKNTTTRSLTGFGNGQIQMYSGLWNNTSAITSMEIDTSNARDYQAGSRFSLYGIKAA